ncbi:MAG: hypothetical protein ACLQOO_24720 [Terriglobia bacterium]
MTNRRTLVVGLVLFFGVGMILSCFATERIVRMTIRNKPFVPAPIGGRPRPATPATFEISNASGGGGSYNDAFAASHTFLVYTSAEVDGLLKSLTDQLSHDKEQLAILNANVKTLSDANDALTKRLSDLETQLNKPQPR